MMNKRTMKKLTPEQRAQRALDRADDARINELLKERDDLLVSLQAIRTLVNNCKTLDLADTQKAIGLIQMIVRETP